MCSIRDSDHAGRRDLPLESRDLQIFGVFCESLSHGLGMRLGIISGQRTGIVFISDYHEGGYVNGSGSVFLSFHNGEQIRSHPWAHRSDRKVFRVLLMLLDILFSTRFRLAIRSV